jgi:hypothetical protein
MSSPFSSIGSAKPPTPSIPIETPSSVSGGSSVRGPEVAVTQSKLKFALVDSGMGGGMTAAFLKGEVRQLGSYFCLPIGEKQPVVAQAYTAGMALWPLVMPLANKEGLNDGHIVDHVVIACNSASVRKEGAVEMMAEFCAKGGEGDMPDAFKDGLVKLADKVRTEQTIAKETPLTKENYATYFKGHVHEIVSKTAEKGANDAIALLGPASKAGGDPILVRVDSTNGTAGSRAYPTAMLDTLQTKLREGGASEFAVTTAPTSTGAYVISHDVLTFKKDGVTRSIVIEGRGNPPWVDAIEAGSIETEQGAKLTGDSNTHSRLALEQAIDKTGGPAKAVLAKLQDRTAPNLSMLCCTHYPAMQASLETAYTGSEVAYINQATIVRELAGELDPESTRPDGPPLDLVLTVGSMNYGGAPGSIRPSIADGGTTAATLLGVLDKTITASGSNSTRALGSVQVFAQGGKMPVTGPEIRHYQSTPMLQHGYELLHKYIAGSKGPEVLADSGVRRVTGARSDEAPFVAIDSSKTVKPVLTKVDGLAAAMDRVTPDLGMKLDRLGVLTTLGETRGVDKIAAMNDQGAQLKAAAVHLATVISSNKSPDLIKKEPVGILTGFTVVDNYTRKRVGGENDGPPGAVIMAKTIVDQGTPVVLVTDKSSEAALATALVGAGLAKLKDGASLGTSLTLAQVDIHKLVAVDIPAVPVPTGPPGHDLPTDNPKLRKEIIAARNAETREAVGETVGRLERAGVKTMITIERPSVTELDGGLYSMLGIDVAPFNLDLSPTLGSGSFKPFTIGIGDGGNELGTGGIRRMTAEGRDENLVPFVNRGSVIGAKESLKTDVMLLSSVSNNGGMTVAMALQAVLRAGQSPQTLEKDLDTTIATYNSVIETMHGAGTSIDGVDKVNLKTVDGRALGSVKQAEERAHLKSDVPLGVGPFTEAELPPVPVPVPRIETPVLIPVTQARRLGVLGGHLRSPPPVLTGAQKADIVVERRILAGETTHNDTFLKFKTTLLKSSASL